jgi:thymidylate synthase
VTFNQAMDSIFGFQLEDMQLQGYDPHPGIKAEVSV